MYPRFLKRSLDVVGAGVGLVCIAPLFPFIAIAIKLDSSGPVFAKIPRISGGKLFLIYKFRTMVKDAHAMKKELAHLNERKDGPFFKIKDDPRLTRVGKVLRKFRIDEFPQLVNVLKGELTLVGPRAHEPEEVEQYPPEYRHVVFAKAGVTGLSQVSGASALPFLKELDLDSGYLANQSFAGDIRIIGKTVKIIFTDPNAV